jgi:hypothetical protein
MTSAPGRHDFVLHLIDEGFWSRGRLVRVTRLKDRVIYSCDMDKDAH